MAANTSPDNSSTAANPTNSPFRVIVVGAGPCGLSLAHALSLANIDFTILERKAEIAEDAGASLVLSPATMRILQQFGVVDKLLPVGAEIKRNMMFGLDGKVWGDTKSPEVFKESHGIGQTSFHRAELVQILYDNLSPESKSKILVGQQITDIAINDVESNSNSNNYPVSVTCSNGTTHHACILIGADGVHSFVRRTMRKLALKQHQNSQQEDPTKSSTQFSHPDLDWDPEYPFPAIYKCLWATFPKPDKINQGLTCDTRAVDKSAMYVTGVDRSWIFLYQKLPNAPQSALTRYTEADQQTMTSLFIDWPMTIGDLKISHALDRTSKMGMSDLGEGICKHWSFGGRIVLVGDACHKFTPNAGQGFNSGLQDVVGLCNLLNGALEAEGNDGPRMGDEQGNLLSTEKLKALFDRYQTSREPEVQAMLQLSVAYGRMQALDGWKWRLLGWVMSGYGMQKYMIGKFISPGLAKSLILDYVPFADRFQGSVKWEFTCEAKGK